MRLERGQRRRDVGKRVERLVGRQKICTRFGRDAAATRRGEVERVFRERPKVAMRGHQRARPGIFELLRAPDFREPVGLGAHQRAVAGDRRMHVEQRAIGVEYVEFVGGHELVSCVAAPGFERRRAPFSADRSSLIALATPKNTRT